MMIQMLTQDGHQVSVASDGAEGLAISQSVHPELIITDVLMPKLDGIEMIMELQKIHSNIPIVAMSGGRRAVSAEFNLESATLVGVKATLSKPFTRSDLRSAIEKGLR
ncbi:MULTISPECIES: response regulator [Methylomonas]|uniref:Response regulator receiver domain-containing protein n=1 Tax=Methylomonas methanica TaxID=421 RepID=A0ABY2CIC8_METMH|nr:MULTISPECIES: response regulator [Methylomonas]TCV78973.1 response regulator receiver domain-containing protein [Methylomonas methanica]